MAGVFRWIGFFLRAMRFANSHSLRCVFVTCLCECGVHPMKHNGFTARKRFAISSSKSAWVNKLILWRFFLAHLHRSWHWSADWRGNWQSTFKGPTCWLGALSTLATQIRFQALRSVHSPAAHIQTMPVGQLLEDALAGNGLTGPTSCTWSQRKPTAGRYSCTKILDAPC